MRREQVCEEVRELAAEVALGVAPGDERARVLAHAATCPNCGPLVAELSRTADALLALAPDLPPPPGSEKRVLALLQRPPRRRRIVAIAAAVAVAAVAGATAVRLAASDELRDAAYYRHVLERAGGRWFGAASIRTDDGRVVGTVFAYNGSPSWVYVVMDEAVPGEAYDVVLVTRDSSLESLGEMEPQPGTGWGRTTDADLRRLRSIVLTDQSGRTALRASFDEA